MEQRSRPLARFVNSSRHGSTIDLNGGNEISLDELLNKTSTSPKTIKIGQTIGETGSNIIKLVDPASRYEIDTQSGVAAVRGSQIVVQVVADGTTSVYNVEGTISFTAQGQEVMIPVGSVSTAKPGTAPSAPQPGTPPAIGSNATSISSQTGWQLTGLYLNAGDKFYVDYRGGSWTVDYKNFSYAGPGGYSAYIDKTITAGYKFDTSVPYGYLLGKVGNGKEILIGNKSGPFTANVSGFLSLRINDIDSALGDNNGAITVNLTGPSARGTSQTLLNTTIQPTQTSPLSTIPVPTSTVTVTPSTTTFTPTSTVTTPSSQTSTALTRVTVWLTTTNDSTAPPVSVLTASSTIILYVWAQGPDGQAGDFELWGILQNGTRTQLGSTFHVSDGKVLSCGQWSGGFLGNTGVITMNVTSGDTIIGNTTFTIN